MAVNRLDFSTTLGAYAHYVIAHSVERFVEQEAAVLKNKDDEPLHQMRVGMRRLRTAIQVFAPAIALPKSVSQSAIAKIAKQLGRTRNFDVMYHQLVHRYQPLVQGKEADKFADVLKALKRQRKASGLELQAILHSDRYRKLKRGLYDWLEQPTYTAAGQQLLLPLFPDLVLPLISQLFLHPGWLVGTTLETGKIHLIPLTDLDGLQTQLQQSELALHDLRKQVKRVRYQAEFLAEFDPDQVLPVEPWMEPLINSEANSHALTYEGAIAEFKWMQDTLGDLQDTFVLQQFLASCLDRPLADQLPTIDQAIQDVKANFWQSWQPIQQRYLLPEFRHGLRSLFHRPLGSQTP